MKRAILTQISKAMSRVLRHEAWLYELELDDEGWVSMADLLTALLYGHSVPGKLRRLRADPPAALFHGTAPGVAESIHCEGLKAMARQYVHLSADERTALEVGRRKSPSPVLFTYAHLWHIRTA